MRLFAATLVVVASALLFPASARAADPVNAAVTLDRNAITVGDRIAMNVIVDADVGYAVNDPTIARNVGTFEVVQTMATQKTSRGAQNRYTYRYAITAWTTGDLVLPPIEVPWAGPNGANGVARTVETPIKVTTVVRQGEDTSDIKPIKPQLGLPEAAWGNAARIAAGLGVAGLITIFVALVLILVMRRRNIALVGERLTPVRRTLRDLDALAELRLPEQGKTAEHYDRLTASLRRYAVECYGVQPGRTSREMRDALERAGLDRMQAGSIYEILREGDEVRFRHSTPYPAHAQNAVRAALEIVRRAASAEEYEIAALQPQ